mgnify:FL=1
MSVTPQEILTEIGKLNIYCDQERVFSVEVKLYFYIINHMGIYRYLEYLCFEHYSHTCNLFADLPIFASHSSICGIIYFRGHEFS